MAKTHSKSTERWKEHFDQLLNNYRMYTKNLFDSLPQSVIQEKFDQPIRVEEVIKAISAVKNNKAAGGDGIPGDIYKKGGVGLARRLTTLYRKIWNSENTPSDFTKALIGPIYKNKGDRDVCGNYRGISL